MPATLETVARRPARASGREAFARAVMAALVDGGGTFSADVPSAQAVTGMATKLRLWLLVTRAAAGGVSATVSPGFLTATYPAMLALARALDEAGLKGLWAPEDERTIRLGKARHMFVSVDRPSSRSGAGSPRPDTLLEIVSADRIEPEWYRSRVSPRATAEELTTVVYGAPGGDGVFGQVRAKNLLAEWTDGTRRHFSLGGAAAEVLPYVADHNRQAGASAFASR